MNPIDFRNETWKSLGEKLTGRRMEAWIAWCQFGPGTTREVAARSRIDILHFRPRTTELYQMGFVVLTEAQTKRGEGVYRALHWTEAQAHFEKRKREASTYQSELQLK